MGFCLQHLFATCVTAISTVPACYCHFLLLSTTNPDGHVHALVQGLLVYWLQHNGYTSHPYGVLPHLPLVCNPGEEANAQPRCNEAGWSSAVQGAACTHLLALGHTSQADCHSQPAVTVPALPAGHCPFPLSALMLHLCNDVHVCLPWHIVHMYVHCMICVAVVCVCACVHHMADAP